MSDGRRVPVAIIGGGFSGTMLAAQLARRGIASALVDGSGREGQGTAYSTREPAHLLNVRAAAMSAWSGEPGHFADYFAQAGGDPTGFAERRLFGRYLGEQLDAARASGVAVVTEQAVSAGRAGAGWTVTLADGSRIAAKALVLAQGNQPPEPLRAFAGAGPRFVNNPWEAEAREAIATAAAESAPVLIVGTGLTMVDLVLSLDSAGHDGRIVALSRRGLIPRGHAAAGAPLVADDVPLGSVTALWRWLRARSDGGRWREAVNSLRPLSQRFWLSLDDVEQRRFLRHARPWWDVHRHRIAPQVSQQLRAMVAAGQLEIVAGRVAGVAAADEGLDVHIRRRGSTRETPERFAFAFNCTGPLGAIARTRDPLLRGLLDAGIARPDALGIGLDVDDRSRVAGGARLWALGPLTKGRLWEIVAVPDIREQVAQVADDIRMDIER